MPRFFLPGLITIGLVEVVLLAALLITNRDTAEKQWPSAEVACREQTPSELVAVADVVATGTVFAVIDGTPYARVLITPVEVYRGSVPDTGITVMAHAVRAGSQPDPGTLPGSEVQFKSSDPPYLLYLHRRTDGTFSTSRCDGTRLLGDGLTVEESAALGISQAE